MLEATESGVGLELIQYKAALIAYGELNDELEVQEDRWTERDQEWNRLVGQSVTTPYLEKFEDRNWHQGHRPSLIETPPKENYPNISFMAYQGRPASNILDQASNYSMSLDIEIMVKGDDEPQTDRRIHRTVEAVHAVFARNEYLDGWSDGFDSDPVVNITDIFTRNEEAGHGTLWYWQAARIRYSLTRNNSLPEE